LYNGNLKQKSESERERENCIDGKSKDYNPAGSRLGASAMSYYACNSAVSYYDLAIRLAKRKAALNMQVFNACMHTSSDVAYISVAQATQYETILAHITTHRHITT